MDVGKAIYITRKNKGLTLSDLAKRSSVTDREIVMLEKGQRKCPKISTLKKLADGLGMPLAELVNLILGRGARKKDWKVMMDDLGSIHIPREARKELGIDYGDYFYVKVEDEKIILTAAKENEAETTGERIKAARGKAGLTQKQLGEKLGISYQAVAQWENDLRNPKIKSLRAIANALEVPLRDLISVEDKT